MGTYGDNFTKEFFKRTIDNLILYDELNRNNSEKYPNNITLLINSLLGLIVFVKESKIKLNKNYIKFIEKVEIWNYNENKNISSFIKHLRNSISHARIVANGNNTQIESITFTDIDTKSNSKFQISLKISEIKEFITALKEEFYN